MVGAATPFLQISRRVVSARMPICHSQQSTVKFGASVLDVLHSTDNRFC